MALDEVQSALRAWMINADAAKVQPVRSKGSFSGAALWKVDVRGRELLLRRWPRQAGGADRIRTILSFQQRLAESNLPVARPQAVQDGGSLVHLDAAGAAWSLTAWMPGRADYWSDPRPEKLQGAMRTLARAHLAATRFETADGPAARSDRSPAMLRRHELLRQLADGGLAELRQRVRTASPSDEGTSLARRAVGLVEQALPRQQRLAAQWQTRPLPLQWRLGDVWHDHVLFIGDDVTGLIDFGAASVDSPAGDVARLLGSLVSDDEPRRRQGLAAYGAVRALAIEEVDAVEAFDSTGTVLSAANWVRWLFGEDRLQAGTFDRPAALERLAGLIRRLEALVS